MKLTSLLATCALVSSSVAFANTNTVPLQSTLYTTSWSMYTTPGSGYPAYQYDGAYDSTQGSWNNRPLVNNPNMVAQFNASNVVAWSFMQAWNSNDPSQAKYGVTADMNGLLHFSDLYADLPPSNIPAAAAMQKTCAILGQYACVAVQMNGNTGQKQLFNYAKDDSTGQFNSFNAFMGSSKYSAKRIIAVGGANTLSNGSVGYYTFEAIFANQDKFTQNLKQWQQAYPNFSGIDYDFEPPIDKSTGGQLPVSAQTKQDYANLLSLVEKTRAAMGPNAYISVTITPNMQYLDAINRSDVDASGQPDWFKKIAQYASTVDIMTYDLHGPWGQSGDPYTAIHAYLAQPNINNLSDFAVQYGGEEVINQVLADGMPANQLDMGIANYGRAFAQVSQQAYPGTNLLGFDQKWQGAYQFPANISGQPGMIDYRFIPGLKSQGYTQYDVHQNLTDQSTPIVGSYLYNPTTGAFIGYESPAEVKAAMAFAQSKGLHGMIFWDAAGDLPVSNPDSLLATFKANNA